MRRKTSQPRFLDTPGRRESATRAVAVALIVIRRVIYIYIYIYIYVYIYIYICFLIYISLATLLMILGTFSARLASL